jgi:hypothetical protein
MKNYKNYLIAVLTGLLVLSLFTQPAQSAAKPVKTYDAVRLANYTACLYFRNPDSRMYDILSDANATRVKAFNGQLAYCAEWKP